MRKNFILYFLTAVLAAGGFHPSGARAAQDQTGVPSVSSHEELTRQSIRDRVRIMRQERSELMPYLDRGYIRSMISADKIR